MMSTVECIACGHVGESKKKGSILVTIILLILFFPAGILYWLLTRTGGKVCSACKSSNVKLYIPKQRASHSLRNDQQANVQQVQCVDCREYIRYDARKCKHCGSVVGG